MLSFRKNRLDKFPLAAALTIASCQLEPEHFAAAHGGRNAPPAKLWPSPLSTSLLRSFAQELAILAVWPFESFCVDIFNIENQPKAGDPSTLPELKALLEPRGYVHLERVGVDEVFRRRPACGIERNGGSRSSRLFGRFSSLFGRRERNTRGRGLANGDREKYPTDAS